MGLGDWSNSGAPLRGIKGPVKGFFGVKFEGTEAQQ